MVCCDPQLANEDTEYYGELETPARWLSDVGNVIVARADRKPLYAHYVKVLIEFLESISTRPWYDSDFDFDKFFASAKERFSPWSWTTAMERVVDLGLNDFKDFYLEKRYQWAMETEEPENLGKLPTPWSWTGKPKQSNAWKSKKAKEKKYRDMNHLKKFDQADHWKERILLREIHALKCLLREAQGALASEGHISDVRVNKRLLVDLKGKITGELY